MKTILKKPRIADASLCLLIRTGKKQCAEILYDTYAKFLFLAIIRIIPERKIAEQVLQATFKKIWFSINDYVLEKERIYTWMVNIAKNLAAETLLKSKSKYESESV